MALGLTHCVLQPIMATLGVRLCGRSPIEGDKLKFLMRTFDCESTILFVLAVLVAILATVSVSNKVTWLAYMSLGGVNFYLACVLVFAAIRSDGLQGSSSYEPPTFMKWFFPTRLVGLIMFPLFAYILVTAFAALYLQLGTIEHFNCPIETVAKAKYFSLVTITTLGYGEIHPVSETARNLVLLQLSSGLLLLFGVFPLLISRISGFTGNS
jgi:ion channel